jgi:branched-subunit amino acid ABC-type transport system permease component
MNSLLPFIVVGVVTGSLYGLAALGLVLTFKTTGVFNFAHGAIAAAAAFLFYQLHTIGHVPWPVALALCVFGFGPAAGLLVERLARRLSDVRPELEVVATVGLLLFVQGFLQWHFGAQTLIFPDFLPRGAVTVSGVQIHVSQMIDVVVAAAGAAGLYLLLRRTRTGVAMRAVVSDPALLGLAGTSPVRIRRLSWSIGCAFAALTGILIAPSLGLDATLLTLLVVQAFGAASIGLLDNLPLTYAGGLIVGISAALATKYVSNVHSLIGLPASIPFIVLFAMLLLVPARRFRSTERVRPPAASPKPMPRPTTGGIVAAAAVALLLLPWLVGSRLPTYTNAVTFALIFASLALLLHLSGQISLCHAAFVAVGATTFSHLTHGLGVPWLLALLLSGLAAVPVGALVAIPAIRLSGVYLALATFGFGILVQDIVFGTAVMFGGRGYRIAPRPSFAHGDRAFYYVVLAVAVVGCTLALLVARARLGRLLRALRDAPVALNTEGLSINTTKVIVFCLSAGLAGMAGALLIAAPGEASGTAFGPFNSLTWLAVLAICGRRLIGSSWAAAASLIVIPAYLPGSFVSIEPMIFGALAILAVVLSGTRIHVDLEEIEDRRRRSAIRARTDPARLEPMGVNA